MEDFDLWDVIVIGGGPAGLTAGMYTSRARLKTKILTGPTPGGQIALTYRVENYPGFYESTTGPELTEALMNHAEFFGADIDRREASSVDFSKSPYTIYTKDEKLKTRTAIIATGSKMKKLGVPGEEKFMGKGVFVCATCDAALYEDLKVVVVGGGDSALQESLDLTRFASEIFVVYRGDDLSGCFCLQERVKENPKIKLISNSIVEEIIGTNYVESVRIRNQNSGEVDSIKTDGVLIAIGWVPNTEIFKSEIKMDSDGYIESDEVRTDLSGIFVAGDLIDTEYRQVVTACSTGCKAALEVERFIMEKRQ